MVRERERNSTRESETGSRGRESYSLTTSMRLSWIRFSVVLSLLLIRPRPDDSYCRIHTHIHTQLVSAPCKKHVPL